MNKRYKPGDRFRFYDDGRDEEGNPLLGSVIADLKWCYRVIYDTKPPMRYNMGQRDTIAIPEQMETLEDTQ